MKAFFSCFLLAASFISGCVDGGEGSHSDHVLNDSLALAHHVYSDPDADATDIYRFLRREADGGNAKAHLELGRYHASLERGDSALIYYDQAIALGDTSALFWAGMIHLRGLYGQPQNVEQYVRLMREASSRGVGRAAEQIDKFISNLETAAASGNQEAQGFLDALAEKDLL